MTKDKRNWGDIFTNMGCLLFFVFFAVLIITSATVKITKEPCIKSIKDDNYTATITATYPTSTACDTNTRDSLTLVLNTIAHRSYHLEVWGACYRCRDRHLQSITINTDNPNSHTIQLQPDAYRVELAVSQDNNINHSTIIIDEFCPER